MVNKELTGRSYGRKLGGNVKLRTMGRGSTESGERLSSCQASRMGKKEAKVMSHMAKLK